MTLVRLDRIRLHDSTQPRVTTLNEVALGYARAMERGAEFPPLEVFFDGTDYWLADGYHRRLAYETVGVTEVECRVHRGTLSDAAWYSCSANASNGLHRTQEDVQLAIKRALLHPKGAGKADRDIACHVGCSNHTVADIRQQLVATGQIAQLTSRVGRDGKRRVVGSKKQPPKAEAQASEPTLVIDRTWYFLSDATDAVVREHRRLPSPEETAAQFPLELADALEMEDVRRIAAWWQAFLPLWRKRQPEIRKHAERLEAIGRESKHVA